MILWYKNIRKTLKTWRYHAIVTRILSKEILGGKFLRNYKVREILQENSRRFTRGLLLFGIAFSLAYKNTTYVQSFLTRVSNLDVALN